MPIKIFIFFLLSIFQLTKQGTKTKVTNLFPQYNKDIYSGYLDTLIDGNKLFYVYYPSQSENPSKDPVILWLNGGPGCSSLFGMLNEVGPVVTDHFSGVFKYNNYSWNMNANLVFIEQPAGVGFSIAKNISHEWNDVENAKNLYEGVKDFYRTFEELNGREFYITGESYAGVFIPHLATEILQDTSSDKINLKGFLVGNPSTDFQFDYVRSLVEFGFYRGLVSIETYMKYLKNCQHRPDELLPDKDIWGDKNNFTEYATSKCNEARDQVANSFNGNELYGIYRICPFEDIEPDNPLYLNRKLSMKNVIMKNIKKLLKNNNNISNKYLEPEHEIWPYNCKDDLTLDIFLNSNSTKEKLNVANISTVWTECAELNYNTTDSRHLYGSTLKNLKNFTMWMFSGTEDGVVSTIGTLRCINELGFKVEKEWTNWKYNGQIAGYVQKYEEGLAFVTIKGAGHMSPQDKRAETKFLLDSFLKGILPSEMGK